MSTRLESCQSEDVKANDKEKNNDNGFVAANLDKHATVLVISYLNTIAMTALLSMEYTLLF